jgi:hypothetical protein
MRNLSRVSGHVGTRAHDPLLNGFLFVEDSDSGVGGGGSYAGDRGGGGEAGSMGAVVCGARC